MMVLLDAIYAGTVNPNLEKCDRHAVRERAAFMPIDYDVPKKRQPRKTDIVDQLNRFAGIPYKWPRQSVRTT